MNNIDWNLIRSFLAVSRQGSLTAAASELGTSQPTLSRDIQAIEAATQLQLFKRSTQGLQLTEEGKKLVEAASQMEDAANLLQRQVSGMSEELEGNVRISANEVVGFYLLPPAITAFREKNSGVDIEIVISNQVSSLSKREADIALRMFRPTQPDLVTRRLPDMELGFYAHESYLKKYGVPEDTNAFYKHSIIGFDENMDFIEIAQQMGYPLSSKNFTLRTDNLLTQIQLAKAGAGIIGTHVGLAEHLSELKRVLEWIKLPTLEFWVVCHSDTQYNSRIKAVRDHLVEWFKSNPYKNVLL